MVVGHRRRVSPFRGRTRELLIDDAKALVDFRDAPPPIRLTDEPLEVLP